MNYNKLLNKINLKYYFLIISIFLGLILFLTILSTSSAHTKILEAKSFISSLESKSFDLRQVIISKKNKPSKDIVIVGIDNISHEYLTNYFGGWPLPRGVYADFIDYAETQNPVAVGIDILFVSPWSKNKKDDIKLANTFSKYDNAFPAIYFDEYSTSERTPMQLPNSIKAHIDNQSKTFKPYAYQNLRALYPELINSTENIGHLNLERSSDGVIRTLPLFVAHPEYIKNKALKDKNGNVKYDYYVNFGLKILLKYLEKKDGLRINDFKVDNKNNLILNSKKVPMNPSSEAILNWYPKQSAKNNSSFNYVSFKDVFISMQAVKNHQKPILPSEIFKDKIVILGFTADGLSDLKTVPNNKLLPGVEIYATFINNVIDNKIIKKSDAKTTCLVSLTLSIVVAMILLILRSTITSLLITSVISMFYVWLSFLSMSSYNLWIPIVLPLASILFTCVFVLALKYIFKSHDYEHVYRLATMDSLTGLHNRRFFQDQMNINFEYCKRYDHYFSLILIDIDNFKIFNDRYGHLSGDAVLRQVSQLIKSSVRRADIVCRYGGEEIAVILPNTINQNAYILANKLCKLIADKKFELAEGELTEVSISLGVSSYPDSGQSVNDIISCADKVLYNAKENGRNQVGTCIQKINI